MIRWHRLCAAFSALLLCYVVVTGAGIQFADMRALVSHAPAGDPDMLKMREHVFGTPNYVVVSAPDYAATPLPANLDIAAAVARGVALARHAMPSATVRFVELRTVAGHVVADVRMDTRDLRFDLASGAALPAARVPPRDRRFSMRDVFKAWHQSRALGHLGTVLNGLAGIALSILIVTGLVHYVRLYRFRSKKGRRSPFWRAGGWWRSLHRWAAPTSVVFVVWIALSGLALSLDNVGSYINSSRNAPGAERAAFDQDLSSPIAPAALLPAARKSLMAFHAAEPGMGIKVFRLRSYAGYLQGVIVAADADTGQYVYNGVSGAPMMMTEPGYPSAGFPLGWEWHQRLKRIHRGDIFGMTGRWLDTIGAIALLYMLASGIVMYVDLWRRRRRAGRGRLIWR